MAYRRLGIRQKVRGLNVRLEVKVETIHVLYVL